MNIYFEFECLTDGAYYRVISQIVGANWRFTEPHRTSAQNAKQTQKDHLLEDTEVGPVTEITSIGETTTISTETAHSTDIG